MTFQTWKYRIFIKTRLKPIKREEFVTQLAIANDAEFLADSGVT